MIGRQSVKNGYFAEACVEGQCEPRTELDTLKTTAGLKTMRLSVYCELFKRKFVLIQV